MENTFFQQVAFPMGLEKETAYLAQGLRNQYQDFFTWVQAGEIPKIPDDNLPQYAPNQANETSAISQTMEELTEPWLLGSWDIEYFYGLSRPVDVNCACPFGWVQKVERVVDQQYPIFGVERFPDLISKAVHVAWLILKNEIFPEYNSGIAALAALVLLRRNGHQSIPTNEDLRRFITVMRMNIKKIEVDELDEDEVIRWLSMLVKAWKR